MLILSLSRQVRKLTDRFKDIFPSANYAALSAMFLYYWAGMESLSDLARSYPGSKSVSSLSDFIRCFDGNRFIRRYRAWVLKKIKKGGKITPERFVLAIDDTDNPKFGKSYRTGKWHGSKGLYNGQRILVLVIVDIENDVTIPLGFRFVGKKTDSDYLSGPDLAFELLKEAAAQGVPEGLSVVMDSWFDSSELVERCGASIYI